MISLHSPRSIGSLWARSGNREGARNTATLTSWPVSLERGADAVRLLAPKQGCSTPDFAIKVGPRELLYESTEIDRPGRRRGDEQQITTVTQVPESDYVSAEVYAAVLRNPSGKKAVKDYNRCDGVIIYDNADVEDRDLSTPHWWAENTQAARARFAVVWCFHSEVFRQIN